MTQTLFPTRQEILQEQDLLRLDCLVESLVLGRQVRRDQDGEMVVIEPGVVVGSLGSIRPVTRYSGSWENCLELMKFLGRQDGYAFEQQVIEMCDITPDGDVKLSHPVDEVMKRFFSRVTTQMICRAAIVKRLVDVGAAEVWREPSSRVVTFRDRVVVRMIEALDEGDLDEPGYGSGFLDEDEEEMIIPEVERLDILRLMLGEVDSE